jgi:hypothetical protein
MTHDPLCLAFDRPPSWEPEMCVCDLIDKVREDERERAGIRQKEASWKYPVPLAPTVRQS